MGPETCGIILQEPFLYSRSILENIGILEDKPDPQAVEAAAKIAHIHEDIA